MKDNAVKICLNKEKSVELKNLSTFSDFSSLSL